MRDPADSYRQYQWCASLRSALHQTNVDRERQTCRIRRSKVPQVSSDAGFGEGLHSRVLAPAHSSAPIAIVQSTSSQSLLKHPFYCTQPKDKMARTAMSLVLLLAIASGTFATKFVDINKESASRYALSCSFECFAGRCQICSILGTSTPCTIAHVRARDHVSVAAPR